MDAEDRHTGDLTQKGAKESPRKRLAEEVEDTGEVCDSMDEFARQVKERMQMRRQEPLEACKGGDMNPWRGIMWSSLKMQLNRGPRDEPATAGTQ